MPKRYRWQIIVEGVAEASPNDEGKMDTKAELEQAVIDSVKLDTMSGITVKDGYPLLNIFEREP